jgi:hypothetical protein
MKEHISRAVIEVSFIVFLFYANLLMGEYENSGMGRTRGLAWAVSDLLTAPNFVIAIVAAVVGYRFRVPQEEAAMTGPAPHTRAGRRARIPRASRRAHPLMVHARVRRVGRCRLIALALKRRAPIVTVELLFVGSLDRSVYSPGSSRSKRASCSRRFFCRAS